MNRMPAAKGSKVKHTVGSSVLPPPPLPISLARMARSDAGSIYVCS